MYLFLIGPRPAGCLSQGFSIQTLYGPGNHDVCMVGKCCAWTWAGVFSHTLLCHNLIGVCCSSGIRMCYISAFLNAFNIPSLCSSASRP